MFRELLLGFNFQSCCHNNSCRVRRRKLKHHLKSKTAGTYDWSLCDQFSGNLKTNGIFNRKTTIALLFQFWVGTNLLLGWIKLSIEMPDNWDVRKHACTRNYICQFLWIILQIPSCQEYTHRKVGSHEYHTEQHYWNVAYQARANYTKIQRAVDHNRSIELQWHA